MPNIFAIFFRILHDSFIYGVERARRGAEVQRAQEQLVFYCEHQHSERRTRRRHLYADR